LQVVNFADGEKWPSACGPKNIRRIDIPEWTKGGVPCDGNHLGAKDAPGTARGGRPGEEPPSMRGEHQLLGGTERWTGVSRKKNGTGDCKVFKKREQSES